eukprot:6013808-Pleurochrysis_carterae.AAC.1
MLPRLKEVVPSQRRMRIRARKGGARHKWDDEERDLRRRAQRDAQRLRNGSAPFGSAQNGLVLRFRPRCSDG